MMDDMCHASRLTMGSPIQQISAMRFIYRTLYRVQAPPACPIPPQPGSAADGLVGA
jgi:hypothetical protein